MLPPEIERLLRQYQSTNWTGTLTLNLKEGTVIAYEVTEKRRIK